LAHAETGESHAKEWIAFAEAIVSDQHSPLPAEQSLVVMIILDSLCKNAAAGREIRLEA